MGYGVEVVPLKGEPELQEDFNTAGAFVNLSLINKSPLLQLIKIHKLTSRDDLILHSHLPRAELMSIFASSRIKKVVSRHNAEPFYPNAPKVLSILLSRIVLFVTDRCIAISKAVELYMRENLEANLKQRIDVVHYGYEYRDGIIPERRNRTQPRALVIGTIARLAPQKDLHVLLAAFALFSQRSPNLNPSLVIVGDGPLREKLELLAQTLGISDTVKWAGKTTDVHSYLSKMDVFALPSKYEGFGLVLLEAMSHGLPIVAARNSAIPEVLGNEYEFLFETSNVFDLSYKLSEVIQSKFDFHEYSRERLILFRPNLMAERIEEIYLN